MRSYYCQIMKHRVDSIGMNVETHVRRARWSTTTGKRINSRIPSDRDFAGALHLLLSQHLHITSSLAPRSLEASALSGAAQSCAKAAGLRFARQAFPKPRERASSL